MQKMPMARKDWVILVLFAFLMFYSAPIVKGCGCWNDRGPEPGDRLPRLEERGSVPPPAIDPKYRQIKKEKHFPV